MTSTPEPKTPAPKDASFAGADERLKRAREKILSADAQLSRLSEQVARMERNAKRVSPAEAGAKSPGATRPSGVVIGLALAACFVVAGLAWQSSFGGGSKPVTDPSAPQLAAGPSSPPENLPASAEPGLPTTLAVAAVEAPPAAVAESPAAAMQVAQTPPPATTPPSAEAPAPAPTPTAPPAETPAAPTTPDQTQLLQTMARDLANLQRSIEQLKASQQQLAGEHAREIAALKASQEEMKRALAKTSEQTPPKASAPVAQAAPVIRKPERAAPPPRARSRPRIPPRWYYEDEDW